MFAANASRNATTTTIATATAGGAGFPGCGFPSETTIPNPMQKLHSQSSATGSFRRSGIFNWRNAIAGPVGAFPAMIADQDKICAEF